MKNNGFTMVELAIALIVIAILIAAAVKGVSSIKTAQIKAEIARVDRIKQGFADYVEKNMTIPGVPKDNETTTLAYTNATRDALINGGFVDKKDFTNKYANLDWWFVRCFPDPLGMKLELTSLDLAYDIDSKFYFMGNVCISTGKRDINTPDINNMVSHDMFSCFYDTLIDDSSYTSGNSRQETPAQTPFPTNCSSAKSSWSSKKFVIKIW